MRARVCQCGEPLALGNKSGLCPQCRAEQRYPSPSLAEIRAGCEAIRSEWSNLEEQRRRSLKARAVEVHSVKCRTPKPRGAHD